MAKGYLELIKEGIESGDLNKIAKAYEGMTGQKAFPPIRMQEREEDNGVTTTNAQLGGGARPGDGNTRFTKKIPVKVAKGNLFVDNGKDYVEQKLQPKEKRGFKKTSGRPKAQTVTVTCTKCGDSAFLEKSALPVSYEETGLKTGTYVCGECVSKRGR